MATEKQTKKVKVPNKFNMLEGIHYFDLYELSFYCSAKFDHHYCSEKHFDCAVSGCWACFKCMIVAKKPNGSEFIFKPENTDRTCE